MRPETALGAGAVGVLAATALLAFLVPGAVATPQTDDPVPPSSLHVREVSIAPGPASGETATLRVDTRLRHAKGPAENVTLELRAVDLDGGLVRSVRRIELGDVTVDGERRVLANLTVPRSGSYRIRTLVYEDAKRVDAHARTVRGVGNVQPTYADASVGFQQFSMAGVSLPPIDYSIEDARGDRVDLNVSAYLVNGGQRPAGDLQLELIARQTESGIVADRATVSVEGVGPGRTVSPSATLTVPDDYDYYLDAVLRADGVVVATSRAGAVLAPNRSLSVDRSSEDGGLRVEEFDPEESPTPTETPAPRETSGDGGRAYGGGADGGREVTSGGGGPGFGVGVAVLALAAVALIARRRA